MCPAHLARRAEVHALRQAVPERALLLAQRGWQLQLQPALQVKLAQFLRANLNLQLTSWHASSERHSRVQRHEQSSMYSSLSICYELTCEHF